MFGSLFYYVIRIKITVLRLGLLFPHSSRGELEAKKP